MYLSEKERAVIHPRNREKRVTRKPSTAQDLRKKKIRGYTIVVII